MSRSHSMRTALYQQLNACAFPIYLLNSDRQLIYCNQACVDWLGRTPDELAGLRCSYSSALEDGNKELPGGLCPPPVCFEGRPEVGTVSAPDVAGNVTARPAWFTPVASPDNTSHAVLVFVDQHGAAASPAATRRDGSPEAIRLHSYLQRYRAEQRSCHDLDRLLGRSLAMRRVREQVILAAASRVGVTVVGPQGSGRQRVARSIHFAKPAGATGSLLTLDCTVLDAEALEATFEAIAREASAADHSSCVTTLVFSELESLSPVGQASLLIFASRTQTRPVRLIGLSTTATLGRDSGGPLADEVAELFSVLTISIPPLMQREEDIPVLAQAFVEQYNARGAKQLTGFDEAAMDRLAARKWPGEVDQLERIVAEACRRAQGTLIGVGDLPRDVTLWEDAEEFAPTEATPIVLDDFLEEVEAELIRRAIAQASGNKAQAARLLGISRPRLLRRIEVKDEG